MLGQKACAALKDIIVSIKDKVDETKFSTADVTYEEQQAKKITLTLDNADCNSITVDFLTQVKGNDDIISFASVISNTDNASVIEEINNMIEDVSDDTENSFSWDMTVLNDKALYNKISITEEDLNAAVEYKTNEANTEFDLSITATDSENSEYKLTLSGKDKVYTFSITDTESVIKGTITVNAFEIKSDAVNIDVAVDITVTDDSDSKTVISFAAKTNTVFSDSVSITMPDVTDTYTDQDSDAMMNDIKTKAPTAIPNIYTLLSSILPAFIDV